MTETVPVPSLPKPWREVLTLDSRRERVAGSVEELRRAIARGADLRIGSQFYHDEHIDTSAGSPHELIEETMDMRATYLIDGRWVAGVLTLRQPVILPERLGPRPSLSLFLYNEDGTQAIARPFLDGPPAAGPVGATPVDAHAEMPKFHELDNWDAGTNAPSSNFIYSFETFRYLVRDDWQEVFAHDAGGNPLSGSVERLAAAFRDGAEVKVGMEGLCDALPGQEHAQVALPHTVFIQCGSCYYYTGRKQFMAGTHPVVRVRPAIPVRYASGNWDYGWLFVRSDGQASRLFYDPHTLKPRETMGRHGMRWFVR